MSDEVHDSWLETFSRMVARWVPDAISAGVIMTVAMAIVALALNNSPEVVMDAYYRGLWMLLPFTMQMTLIIVLSSALGVTPFFRKTISLVSGIPKTRNQVVVLTFLLTAVVSYLYWGLGIALAPIIAVYFAMASERKGINVDFPFLIAVTAGAQSVWQFGVSASAPLLVATEGHFLQSTIGVLPLSTTIWSPAAILHEVLFTVAGIVVACRLMPKGGTPISAFPESCRLTGEAVDDKGDAPAPGLSGLLERSPLVSLTLAAMFAAWLYYHFFAKKLSLDINSLNVTLFFLAFVLNGNIRRFTKAVQQAVVASWAVIVLYNLYAGVAGLIQFTNVGEKAALMAASIANTSTFPFITALGGSVFSFFIPSSGGQWSIQGFVTSRAAMDVGVSVQRGILALSVGDQMGNLMTPFWCVVIAGIARIDFRKFFGYCLIFAAIWFVVGVIVFTFAPC